MSKMKTKYDKAQPNTAIQDIAGMIEAELLESHFNVLHIPSGTSKVGKSIQLAIREALKTYGYVICYG